MGLSLYQPVLGAILVRKKGRSYRLSVDYRSLNINDAYPLSQVDETLDSSNACQFRFGQRLLAS